MSAMADAWLSDTRTSYDTDASGYAEKVRGLLDQNPYLRASLALFADLVHDAGGGPVADIGCGPGYVTGYLHDAGLDVFGIDLSPEMIAIARRDYPDLSFEVGTMTELQLADDSVAGHHRLLVRDPRARRRRARGVRASSVECCDQGPRYWSAFTSVTRLTTGLRATRVVPSTLIVTIVVLARSRVGFAMSGSRLRPNWS